MSQRNLPFTSSTIPCFLNTAIHDKVLQRGCLQESWLARDSTCFDCCDRHSCEGRHDQGSHQKATDQDGHGTI